MNGLQLLVLWLALCAGQWSYGAFVSRGFDFAQAYHQGAALLAVWALKGLLP